MTTGNRSAPFPGSSSWPSATRAALLPVPRWLTYPRSTGWRMSRSRSGVAGRRCRSAVQVQQVAMARGSGPRRSPETRSPGGQPAPPALPPAVPPTLSPSVCSGSAVAGRESGSAGVAASCSGSTVMSTSPSADGGTWRPAVSFSMPEQYPATCLATPPWAAGPTTAAVIAAALRPPPSSARSKCVSHRHPGAGAHHRVAVDPRGQPDQPSGQRAGQHHGERHLPLRGDAQRGSHRHQHGGEERDQGQHPGEPVLRIDGQHADAHDVRHDDQHEDGPGDRADVLLPRHQRPGGREQQGVEQEAEQVPRQRPADRPTAMPDGMLSTPVPRAAASPAAATTTSCPNPTEPMPTTLPSISCHGRTVASNNSTTRLVFSSTTPWATV